MPPGDQFSPPTPTQFARFPRARVKLVRAQWMDSPCIYYTIHIMYTFRNIFAAHERINVCTMVWYMLRRRVRSTLAVNISLHACGRPWQRFEHQDPNRRSIAHKCYVKWASEMHARGQNHPQFSRMKYDASMFYTYSNTVSWRSCVLCASLHTHMMIPPNVAVRISRISMGNPTAATNAVCHAYNTENCNKA